MSTLTHYEDYEDYEELKECLGQTFKEIEVVKSEGLEIDEEHYDVKWWVAISLAKPNPFCSSLIYENHHYSPSLWLSQSDCSTSISI